MITPGGSRTWGSTPDDREALDPLTALHAALDVWMYDDTNGVFVQDESGEKVLMARLCRECSEDQVVAAVEDCEWHDGWPSGEVEWPCPTVEALAEHDAQVRRETAEKIAQAIEGMESFAHGKNALSQAHLIGYVVAQRRASAIARQPVKGGA